MKDQDRRTATRIACLVPVRLSWDGRVVDAIALDLSCFGARISIPTSALFETPADSVVTLAGQLCEVLPPRLSIDFNPDLLGGLVKRNARVCRLGLGANTEDAIEVGCRLDTALCEVDAAALGIPMPGAGETLEDALRRPVMKPYRRSAAPTVDRRSKPRRRLPRVKGRETTSPPPAALPPTQLEHTQFPGFKRRLLVNVRGANRPRRDEIVGWTESLDAEEVVVLVPERSTLGLSKDADQVGALLAEFCETYGSHLELEIVDRTRRLWSGPVRIHSVEVLPRNKEALLLGFSYAGELQDADRQALGL